MNASVNKEDLWSYIDAIVDRRGDHPLWILRLAQGGKKSVTYQQVRRKAYAICQQLRSLGVQPEDRVGILASNGPGWGAAAFAIWRLGAIVAPLHTGNSDEELLLQCQALSPRCTLYEGGSRSLPNAHALVDTELDEDEFSLPSISADSEAVRIYTSGSTGNPKLVRLSHHNILSNVRAAAKLDIKIDGSDRFLSLLPLSHAMEMTGGLLLPMYHGASIVLPRVLAASEILQALVEERITLMIAVPRLYRNVMLGMEKKFSQANGLAKVYINLIRRAPPVIRGIINAPIRKKFGGRIKCWLSGGSRLDPDIGRYFRNLGFPLIQGYGLTECSPVVSVQSMKDNIVESVGPPLDGVEIKIHQENEIGEGELWVKGPNLMLGYVDEQQTHSVIQDGWYKTGDIARLVDGGKIVLTGRSKRIIVTEAGKNVYPEDIEIMLEKHPDLKEAGIVEVDMRPAAVLAIEDKNIAKAEEIIKSHNLRVSSHNQIVRYAVVEELPRTPLGKVSIKDLPAIFEKFEVK